MPKVKKISKLLLESLKFMAFPLTLLFAFCLPNPLFNDPYSQVLLSEDARLLNAQIASDGQWRFPVGHVLPERYEQCILTFEDKNYYRHVGISIKGLARATFLNLKAGKVVSGGSTITMQTVRMARKRRGRSLKEKLIEMFIALRLELSYSKKEILIFHTAHAPFGGNVVGLEAASWRYFGREPSAMSWSESALLAVLPNAPGLMHLGKNRAPLKAKRDGLLLDLEEAGILTKEELHMAMAEPLPEAPVPLPQLAMHLAGKTPGGLQVTGVSFELQKGVSTILEHEKLGLKSRGINNAAVLVYSIKHGTFKAYCGNHKGTDVENGFVNIPDKPRSSGSILKPFLYAAAIEEGLITPYSLLPDYPLYVYGYEPKNYNGGYDGMVKAHHALQRSLNIPAVQLLAQYGVPKFKHKLEQLGSTTLEQPASHYGLSLILGGSECTLEDLCVMYASFSKSMEALSTGLGNGSFSAGVAYAISDILSDVERPGNEQFWKRFDQRNKVAWKTGTSFGARDAWAVGYNSDYVVAVWCGNSSGEGVAGMTGANTAGPILFRVFQLLPKSDWFTPPIRNMRTGLICSNSGEKAGPHCPQREEVRLPKSFRQSRFCTYHKPIWVEKSTQTTTFKTAQNIATGKDSILFDLPIQARTHYAQKHPNYSLDQKRNPNQEVLKLIYPLNKAKISLPKYLDGQKGEVIFSAAYSNKEAELMWFLDGQFLTSTKAFHQVKLDLLPGKHKVYITDEHGTNAASEFEVI